MADRLSLKKANKSIIPYIATEVVENIRRKETLLLMAITVVILCLSSSFEVARSLQWRYETSVLYWMSSGRITQFTPLLYASCSAVSTFSFCEEWRTGMWKYIEMRMGKTAYVKAAIWQHFIMTFLCVVFSQLCWIMILLIIASGTGVPVRDVLHPELNMTGAVALDILLRVVMQSISVCFWAMIALFMAQIKNELFFSLAVPSTMYMFLNYLSYKWLPYPFNIGIVNMESLVFSDGQLSKYGLFLCFLMLLTILVGTAAEWLLKKRVEHEMVS